MNAKRYKVIPVALFFWVRAISASISLILSIIPMFSRFQVAPTKKFKNRKRAQLCYLLKDVITDIYTE